MEGDEEGIRRHEAEAHATDVLNGGHTDQLAALLGEFVEVTNSPFLEKAGRRRRRRGIRASKCCT